jgi:hypothetical protein
MLCGWTTTSTRSCDTRNSQQASASSSPLFMSVAESTEILRPMSQFGCAQACSGVTPARNRGHGRERGRRTRSAQGFHAAPSARDRARRGQALEDRVVLRIHRQQRRAAASTACMNSAPAITSASLLASSRRLPARAAASAEGIPAAPTIAAMTTSTSSCAATSHRAWARENLCCPQHRAPRSAARSAAAACVIAEHRIARPEAQALLKQRLDGLLRARANTSEALGVRAMTSSVLTPMEPLAPRITTGLHQKPTSSRPRAKVGAAAQRLSRRSSNPPCPEAATGVLHTAHALDHAHSEITQHGRKGRGQRHDHHGGQTQVIETRAEAPEQHAQSGNSDDATPEALPGLTRADAPATGRGGRTPYR